MATPPKPNRKPYRVFLSAALHRRFIRATSFSLILCYFLAILIGQKKSLFWSWFPLGLAGIRTLLLFLSSLCIFVLRVANMHVGAGTADSQLHAFFHNIQSLRPYLTIVWYFFSAWLFCETYIWCAPQSAELGWVVTGKAYERSKLNERPIYLRCVFFMAAAIQSMWHIYHDSDQLSLPVVNRRGEERTEHGSHLVISPLERVRANIVPVLISSAYRSVVVAALGPFVYWIFLRQFAWKCTLFIAKLLWDIPRSQRYATGIPPYHIYVIVRSALWTYQVMVSWELSNLLLDAFASEEPLKLGKPLTDVSKDKNGSLLTGLKSNKELPQTFAFWELMLISEKFPDRRKTIFEELDREGGSTWKQMLTVSLDVISGIKDRIEAQLKEPAKVSEPLQLQVLPSLIKNPPKEDNIFAKPPEPKTTREWTEKMVTTVAKSYGTEPDWTPKARQTMRKALHWSEDKAPPQATSTQRASKSPTTGEGAFFQRAFSFILYSSFGRPFRMTTRQRAAAIVLGSPHSRVTPIVDAIESVTRLLICSLREDPFGKAQEDVPGVVRTFTTVINSIKTLLETLKPHWTDVYHEEEEEQEEEEKRTTTPDEVKLVLECLEDRLGELLGAFSLYLEDVGVRGDELIAAKKAAASGGTSGK